MKKNHSGYWATVGLFCAVYSFSAIMDLFGVGPAKATLAHLGYPAYVAAILGTWKAGAVVSSWNPNAVIQNTSPPLVAPCAKAVVSFFFIAPETSTFVMSQP